MLSLFHFLPGISTCQDIGTSGSWSGRHCVASLSKTLYFLVLVQPRKPPWLKKCFYALYPSLQFFSHVATISCLLGLNQYQRVDKVSCPMTQHSDSAGSESQTSSPSIPILRLPTEPLRSI